MSGFKVDEIVSTGKKLRHLQKVEQISHNYH